MNQLYIRKIMFHSEIINKRLPLNDRINFSKSLTCFKIDKKYIDFIKEIDKTILSMFSILSTLTNPLYKEPIKFYVLVAKRDKYT